MPRDSSGQYTKIAGSTAVSGTTISSASFNAEIDDIGTELTNSLPVTGVKGMSAGAQLKLDTGSAAAPALTTTGDLDTGWYSSGANEMSMAAGGIKVLTVDSTGVRDGAWTDVASATTTDLGAVLSRNLRITGTTNITSFGTVASGVTRKLRFAGALTISYNATSMILPTGADIITAAGDTATAVSLGSGNWIVTDYQRATGRAVGSKFTQAASQASTSGTSIDFTSIPSGVTRIQVLFSGVSTNGTAQIRIQIGAGSVTATGYAGAADGASSAGATSAATFTTGLALTRTGLSAAAAVIHGIATLVHLGSNVWAMNFLGSRSDSGSVLFSAASITLGGTLDRVRVTADGTDTFDAGTIGLVYE